MRSLSGLIRVMRHFRHSLFIVKRIAPFSQQARSIEGRPKVAERAGLLPRITPESAFFWTAHDDGALWMLKNARTGEWMHPPPPDDPATAEDLTPSPLSGKGTVFTFTINHQAFLPDLPFPYLLAIVHLFEHEDLHLTT